MSEDIPKLPDPPEPSVAIREKYKDDCQCEHCKNRRAYTFWTSRKGRILKAFIWAFKNPVFTYILGSFIGLLLGLLIGKFL